MSGFRFKVLEFSVKKDSGCNNICECLSKPRRFFFKAPIPTYPWSHFIVWPTQFERRMAVLNSLVLSSGHADLRMDNDGWIFKIPIDNDCWNSEIKLDIDRWNSEMKMGNDGWNSEIKIDNDAWIFEIIMDVDGWNYNIKADDDGSDSEINHGEGIECKKHWKT